MLKKTRVGLRPQVMGRWCHMVKNGRSDLIPKTPSLALVRSLVNIRTQTKSQTLVRKSSPSGKSNTQKALRRTAPWMTRNTMICDLPECGKMQPNHPDPMGPPLDYMGECWVFDGIWLDIYDLCHFYALGMTGNLPEFPVPWEPATHGQVRDLLKLAHSIGRPYLILAYSAD